MGRWWQTCRWISEGAAGASPRQHSIIMPAAFGWACWTLPDALTATPLECGKAARRMLFTGEAPTCALMASTGIVLHGGRHRQRVRIAQHRHRHLDATDFHTRWGSLRVCFGCVQWQGVCSGRHHRLRQRAQVYDVATNMWSAGTAAPNDFLLAGYQQVGQFLYVVGGFEASGPNAAAQSSVLNRGQQSKQPKVPLSSMLKSGLQPQPSSANGEQHNHVASGHEFSPWGMDHMGRHSHRVGQTSVWPTTRNQQAVCAGWRQQRMVVSSTRPTW